MSKYLIFGVNIGNFNLSRNSRPPVTKQVDGINQAFKAAKIQAKITGYFRGSGNFVLETTHSSLGRARSAAQKALLTKVGTFPLAKIEKAVAKLRLEVEPKTEVGIRPTPGLALLVEGPTRSGKLLSTKRNKLLRFSDDVVGAWKLDILTTRKTLDSAPSRRRGGWGGVSQDIAKQLGGLWTARSLSSINGVIMRAKE